MKMKINLYSPNNVVNNLADVNTKYNPYIAAR